MCCVPGIASIPGQGSSDSRWDLTCHFAIVNWHLSFVIWITLDQLSSIFSLLCFLQASTHADCWVHLGRRILLTIVNGIFVPHLYRKSGCHLKITLCCHLILKLPITAKFRPQNEKKHFSVSCNSFFVLAWFPPGKRVCLAFPFSEKKSVGRHSGIPNQCCLTEKNLVTAASCRRGNKMQHTTDGIYEMCHIFIFHDDKMVFQDGHISACHTLFGEISLPCVDILLQDKAVVNCDSCDSVRPCPGWAQTEGQMTKLSSGLYTVPSCFDCCTKLLCCHLRWHKQLSLNRGNVKTENKSPPPCCLHDNQEMCLHR